MPSSCVLKWKEIGGSICKTLLNGNVSMKVTWGHGFMMNNIHVEINNITFVHFLFFNHVIRLKDLEKVKYKHSRKYFGYLNMKKYIFGLDLLITMLSLSSYIFPIQKKIVIAFWYHESMVCERKSTIIWFFFKKIGEFKSFFKPPKCIQWNIYHEFTFLHTYTHVRINMESVKDQFFCFVLYFFVFRKVESETSFNIQHGYLKLKHHRV